MILKRLGMYQNDMVLNNGIKIILLNNGNNNGIK